MLDILKTVHRVRMICLGFFERYERKELDDKKEMKYRTQSIFPERRGTVFQIAASKACDVKMNQLGFISESTLSICQIKMQVLYRFPLSTAIFSFSNFVFVINCHENWHVGPLSNDKHVLNFYSTW